MKVLFLRAVFGALALTSFSAHAQMHKVAKPEQVVRAIGVYEWTGDLTKPKASRLIPVSIFIDGKLEDAGVYVARPVPFALLTGNVYELQDAGIDKALLDLAYARHLQAVDSTGDMAWDDGWFGYGSVKPLAAPRKAVALKPSKNLPVITGSKGSTASADTSRPKLQTKTPNDTASSGADQSKTTASDSSSGTSSTSSSDPDRPTMKRRSDSGSGDAGTTAGTTSGSASSASTTASETTTTDTSAKSSGSASADDPDRPTMKRRSDTTTDTTSASSTTTSPAPADDPDRPTMKRRTDSSGTDAGTTASSGSTTTDSAKSSGNTPTDDPDRPTMKRRSSDDTTDSTTTASTTGSAPSNDPDRPTLKRHAPDDPKRKNGSDSASVSGVGSLNDDPSRPTLHHGKPTSAMTETDLPKLVGMPSDLHQMVAVSDAVNRDPHEFALAWDDDAQRMAVLQKVQALARAQLASYGAKPATTAAAKPAVSAKKTTTTTTAAKARRPAAASAATLEPLLDEELKAYTLSYGGAATYVYTAHTGGTGAALRYVTIVVQADGLGELKPAIQSVTDAAHLDRTPRMRFVDVVDAEASNRASLLFELRGQNSRQFGIYRVIAAHSEQTFLTGTTQ